MTNEMISDMVRYTEWASVTTLDACAVLSREELHQDLQTAYPSIWATLVHVYQADCRWWNRFQGIPVGTLAEFEPGSSLDELRERWQVTLDELIRFTSALSDDELRAPLEFRTTKGTQFRQPIWQAIVHVVNHGTLHRGQILAMFRQIGRVPTSVDVMHYFRQRDKDK